MYHFEFFFKVSETLHQNKEKKQGREKVKPVHNKTTKGSSKQARMSFPNDRMSEQICIYTFFWIYRTTTDY